MWSQPALTDKIKGVLKGFVASRQYDYDADKKRLVPNAQIPLDGPWAFFGCSTGARNCHLWKKVMFDQFSLVPEFCRLRCHKIVARPKNVVELIKTYHFAQAIPFFSDATLVVIPGKAGRDNREYTPQPWGAFWYAQGPGHAQFLLRLSAMLCVKPVCMKWLILL